MRPGSLSLMSMAIISWSLVLALSMPAACYTYHIPVTVQSTLSPEVLMPGDTGILSIQLQNGAAQYGIGEEGPGPTLSTPVNATILQGTGDIEVLSPDYEDIGLMGPTDKVPIYYKIRALDNASDGTHLLNFSVKAGYDLVSITRSIPVLVDSSSLSISRAEVSGKNSISLDVANPRGNTLNAVSIIPSGPGVTFSPEEYYIGTMEPDEVFTISFGISSGWGGNAIPGQVNMSFQSRFKNGETWHRSELYNTTYFPLPEVNNSGNLPLIVGAVLIVVAVGFAYWYRKRRKGSNSN